MTLLWEVSITDMIQNFAMIIMIIVYCLSD
jgi:hypothetical protein